MKTLPVRFAPTATTLVLLGLGAAALYASVVSAAPPEVITEPATVITTSDATLHASVGDTDASATAFWVSTSTFTPTGGASPTLPMGVYSSGALGAAASSSDFSTQLSSMAIPGPLTIEAGTTYYYVAWVEIEGVWYPGEVETLTTVEEDTEDEAPSISNIMVTDIDQDSATIEWDTDVDAVVQVLYGTTTGYGLATAWSSTASTSHSATLSDLDADTLYHFAIRAANSQGTTTSADQTFTTDEEEAASTTPLTVVSITPVNTSATANGTFESGWSWVMRLSVPTDEDAFRMSFTDWTGSEGTFEGGGNVRISSPQSSNASTTASGMVSPADNGYSDWLYLTGDANALMAGRQIDVTIEVRIPEGTAAGSYSTNFSGNSTMQSATSTTP